MREKVLQILGRVLWRMVKAAVSGFSMLIGLAELLSKMQPEKKGGC